MKKIVTLFALLCIGASFAQAPHPREHRGFYFSAGVGTQYLSQALIRKESGNYAYVCDENQNNCIEIDDVDWKEKNSFKGIALPSLEIKMGRSFGNLLSTFFIFAPSIYEIASASSEHTKSKDGVIISRSKETDGDEQGLAIYFGFGFDVFPFRNPNSALNGLYIGTSSGIFFTYGDLDDYLNRSDAELISEQIEIGKNWWLNDTWSVGVSFIYGWNYSNLDDDYDVDMNKFQLLFKIIHR